MIRTPCARHPGQHLSRLPKQHQQQRREGDDTQESFPLQHSKITAAMLPAGIGIRGEHTLAVLLLPGRAGAETTAKPWMLADDIKGFLPWRFARAQNTCIAVTFVNEISTCAFGKTR